MDDVRPPEKVSVIQYQRKRKRLQKVKDLETECDVLDTTGLNSLPDDVLIAILSRMSLVEAVRTSVLSRRWRHLWRFTSGSLDFNVFKVNTGLKMDGDEVITWVNRVIELHQGPRLDSFIVCFYNGVYDDTILRWIYFAMKKEVKKFELKLGYTEGWACHYDFPNLKKLLSLNCAFGSLTSLKLWFVNIPDEVVHYLLASCPYLESLSITSSSSTRKLEIVDPISNLKTLEISYCSCLESLKVSAASIVSFSFRGLEYQDSKLSFGNIPNLRELTLKGDNARSFIYEYEDNKQASYSVQLVKLSLHLYATKYTWVVRHSLPQLYSLKRLEMFVECRVGQSLLFFTLLIKAVPLLHEFRIKVNYDYYRSKLHIPFPNISEVEAPTFHHENLKLVEIGGYVGCPSEGEFLLHLFKVAPSIEKVVIEVKNIYFFQGFSEHFYEELKCCYHNNLQIQALTMKEANHRRIEEQMMKEAEERAKHLQSVFPPNTQLVVR